MPGERAKLGNTHGKRLVSGMNGQSHAQNASVFEVLGDLVRVSTELSEFAEYFRPVDHTDVGPCGQRLLDERGAGLFTKKGEER